jgi:membrane protein
VAARAHQPPEVVRRVRALHPRRTAEATLRAFDAHDLLTYATAIAFNAIFAVIPLALFGLGLLGVLGLEDIWTDHLAPDLRGQVSGDVFAVLDSSVRNVLGAKRLFWVTFGLGLAIWEVSGAMRAVMTVLDRIYHVTRERSRVDRYAVSLVLSAMVTALVVIAALVFELAGPAAHAVAGAGALESVCIVLRWPVAAALLLAAVATVVRWAPAEHRHWHWVRFGTALVVGAWLCMSVLFGLYLRNVAEYGSIFGNLATVIVAFEYAYLSAIVFLAGLAVDGIAQEG